jgi:hypothetical protein
MTEKMNGTCDIPGVHNRKTQDAEPEMGLLNLLDQIYFSSCHILDKLPTIVKDPETYCTASLQISPMSFLAAMHTSLVLCINKNGYISTGVIRFNDCTFKGRNQF